MKSIIQVCQTQRIRLHNHLKLERIVNNTSDPRIEEIYKLRYNVMVRNNKTTKFDKNHQMVHGEMFRDKFDDLSTTVHQIVSHKGKIIASNRIVDGRDNRLEMEEENWFDVRAAVKTDSIAEPGRLVADKSARGTRVIPMLYLDTCDWFMENNVSHCTPMVNNKASNLIKHYTKWTGVGILNDNPVSVDSFLEGQKSNVFLLNFGKDNTKERSKFVYTNYLPSHLMLGMMNNHKYI